MIEIFPGGSTVKVAGGVRYGELAQQLDRVGFALRNLGSLPHISVAGACATGTRGSGDANQSLAASVIAPEMVTADGELARLERGGVAEHFLDSPQVGAALQQVRRRGVPLLSGLLRPAADAAGIPGDPRACVTEELEEAYTTGPIAEAGLSRYTE